MFVCVLGFGDMVCLPWCLFLVGLDLLVLGCFVYVVSGRFAMV